MILLAQAEALPRLIEDAQHAFIQFVQPEQTGVLFVLLASLAAFAVGALHALAPGHGKSIAAAYLVGARGRRRDALLLGVAVALMHTASVLVLALVYFALARSGGADPLAPSEGLYPLLRLAAALLVLLLGVGLVVRRVRGHGERPHHHDHPHLPPEVSPLSRRGLVVLGVYGGLLPSPAATVVLTTLLFVDRPGLGVWLVLAFSAGLAATLTVLGLVVLRGRDAVRERARTRPGLARVLAVSPLLASLLVLAAGVVLTTAAVLPLL